MKLRKSSHPVSKHNQANYFSARTFFAGLYEVGDRHSYIFVQGGDQLRRIIGAEGVDKEKTFRVRDVDGAPTTVIVCRNKYLESILKCTTFSQLYNFLLQKLSENDIREFFYPIWIGNHNFQMRRAQRAEMNRNNFLHKRGIKTKGIAVRRSGMSIRQAANTYGAL